MTKEQLEEEIKVITELLYQQKVTEGYEKLNKLIQDLSVYVTQITDPAKQMELLNALKEALEAMEQKDTTLLADVLQYELLEKL